MTHTDPQAGASPSDEAPPAARGADLGRRYVALLFADLSRSTELAAAMEAEDYAALLAALRQAYQDIMPRHGGLVVRVQGDGLLAMFGHPRTREDDGRRAVEAALALHERVRALRCPVPDGHAISLHTGIHSGLVLIHAGDIERGRFELLGPVPNIASRLSDAAAPHEILVSEETLGPASRAFHTGAVRSLQVKGREAPIRVVSVDARAAPATRLDAHIQRAHAPFVGREAELQLLQQQLEQALAGTPCSVAVAGAAGLGKTRLIEQFLGRAEAQGWRVLRGYCDSELGAEPLQPFRHMLQAAGAQAQGAEAFAEVFAGLAARQPLLLFIDDVQWADDASRRVLAAVRRLQGCRLMVVMSARDAGSATPPDAAALTLHLQPLSDSETALAIAERLPGADPFVAAEIARHAGGNPLFIDELCHSAARGDPARRDGRLHGGAGWLDQLVESRVQHLPAEQAEVVRTAAVIGNVMPAWLLQRIAGHGQRGPLLQGLAEHDFIFPGERSGTLRFKHGIVRDVIYDSVGLHARQALHRRTAEALLAPAAEAGPEPPLEALAYHFDAAGDAEQAAHYAELAGDKAAAASALDRARALYRAALAALDKLPQSAASARRWVAIVQRIGMVCVFDPSRAELALAERAVRLAEQYGDTAAIARTRFWLGYIAYALGDTLAAIAHGERALAEARAAGDAPLATQLEAMLGEAHTAAAHYGPALELLDRAIAIKRSHRSGKHTNVGLAYSLVCRASVLGDRGQFGLAHECFGEALHCIVGLRHEVGASTHGWHSAVLLWQGRWAEARDAAAASADTAQATGSLAQLSIARALAGYADWMLGRAPAALQAIADATAWLEPRAGLFRSLNHGWLADGLAHSGRGGEARHHAALALKRARQRDLIGVAMACRALAHEEALRSPSQAQRHIALALRVANARESAHELAATQLCAAEVALRQGRRSAALASLDQAQPAFEHMAMPWHLGEAARLRASLSSA